MAVIAYLFGLTLAGGGFWLLWKWLRSLRRRGKAGYYLAAAWAGAIAGILFSAAFYLTGQGEVLFDAPTMMSAREIVAGSVTIGVLFGVGMAWQATWQPSPLNEVDIDQGPWTPELVEEMLRDAEHASFEKRGQIAEQLRGMARDSKSRLPEDLERYVARWEREASQVRVERLP